MARTLIGTVVSAKNDKTIVVRIDTHKSHPLYRKRVLSSTKLHAHDEKNEAGQGDLVEIIESKPISRLKRWQLTKVVEKAVDPEIEV